LSIIVTIFEGSGSHLHINDVDEAIAAVGGFADTMQLIPRAVGPLDLRFDIRAWPMMATYVQYWGLPVTSTARLDAYFLNFPLFGEACIECADGCRAKGAPGSGLISNPGPTWANYSYSPHFAQVGVIITTPVLRATLEAMLNRPVAEPIVFNRNLNMGMRWFELLDLLARETTKPDGWTSHPLVASHLQQLVVESLLSLQTHNYSDALAGDGERVGSIVVAHAIELMHEQLHKAWTVSTLAQACGVTARGLQRAFVREGHPSPMIYLRQLRLTRVHMDLLAADPATTTVMSVAARWGFLHPGRFAFYYREQFGQTPSQTLRAAML
jgi:AraC-like DNA-binding protein